MTSTPVVPGKLVTSATKKICKTKARCKRITKATMIEDEDMDTCEIISSVQVEYCTGAELAQVVELIKCVCTKCGECFMPKDQVKVQGDVMEHVDCPESIFGDLATRKVVHQGVARAGLTDAIDPMRCSILKKIKRGKAKKIMKKPAGAESEAIAFQCHQKQMEIGKNMAKSGDGWSVKYEPRMRSKGSWINPRHGVQVRITGAKGKSFSFDMPEDADIEHFTQGLGEAVDNAIKYVSTAGMMKVVEVAGEDGVRNRVSRKL